MIRGVAFDLDDTLYFERDYVRSGFAYVAAMAGDSDDEVRELEVWLQGAFEAGIRGDTFDRLLLAFPSVAMRISVSALVDSYRAHPPTIALIPGLEEVLQALRRQGLRLGVITDGPPSSQAAKAMALGLDRLFDPILITGSLGPGFAKPATGAFEAISAAWGIPHDELAYVADNPDKDFLGPRRLGWLTVRLRLPMQLRCASEPTSENHRPDFEVRLPADLLRCLSVPSSTPRR